MANPEERDDVVHQPRPGIRGPVRQENMDKLLALVKEAYMLGIITKTESSNSIGFSFSVENSGRLRELYNLATMIEH
jgi:hypothetical protein